MFLLNLATVIQPETENETTVRLKLRQKKIKGRDTVIFCLKLVL